MSTYINIDTGKRSDKRTTGPCEFELTSSQTSSWFRPPRMVREVSNNMHNRTHEFATTIGVCSFVTPYEINDTPIRLDTTPVLYLDIHSRGYNDIHLVSSIDGLDPDTKFVLVQDEIQNDDAGNPVWIRWKSKMRQSMRFKRDGDFVFRLYDKDGVTIPIDDQELVALAGTPVVDYKTTVPLPPYTYGANVITLTGAPTTLNIDGNTLVNGDTVLITTGQQTTDNGVYTVGGVGVGITFTRVVNFQSTDAVTAGTYVDVMSGIVHGGQRWVLDTDVAAVDTDPVTFTQDTEYHLPERQVHAVFELMPYDRDNLTDATSSLRIGV